MSIVVAFTFFRIPGTKFPKVGQELEQIVADTVKNNKLIKNCTLHVTRGDGTFTWAGAAGMAEQADKVPMTKDTPVYIASITKMYIAVTIMILYERGLVRLNDPMSEYLPQELIHGLNVYQEYDYSSEITIEQLLAHTSGIPDYYGEKGKDGRTLSEIFKDDLQRNWRAEDQFARVRNDLTSRSRPGEKAIYSDTNYQLLGKIIEARTGKPLHLVLSEFLFIPLNLRNTWLAGFPSFREKSSVSVAEVFSEDVNIAKLRSSTFYWADGGIISTPEDEVTFLKALREGRIFKPATLELMHNWNQIENAGPIRYGFGTMEIKAPSPPSPAMNILPVWGHMGSTGSFLCYSPGKDLYIAGTINQTKDNKTALLLMIRVMQLVARIFGN